ncbi:hypothetical protein EIN_130330 [Entamoeba invadens IP1]|uniref:Uncharacterized protein n=1 Tax=Entamoeba invadens IP1 TaxID=370355 RepID=A0A0A1UD70_ENTIV|nr:hypothetical protein EIN_130330 [Entamoeba invadens IP1]ELP94304.1 hypothetical protein EIN_130330 [Entamoeba invadens IP1]|eukprot:XP_004261075.1 hypothetical protein EIN_130330 [Entamoeba invadens IP1]
MEKPPREKQTRDVKKRRSENARKNVEQFATIPVTIDKKTMYYCPFCSRCFLYACNKNHRNTCEKYTDPKYEVFKRDFERREDAYRSQAKKEVMKYLGEKKHKRPSRNAKITMDFDSNFEDQNNTNPQKVLLETNSINNSINTSINTTLNGIASTPASHPMVHPLAQNTVNEVLSQLQQPMNDSLQLPIPSSMMPPQPPHMSQERKDYRDEYGGGEKQRLEKKDLNSTSPLGCEALPPSPFLSDKLGEQNCDANPFPMFLCPEVDDKQEKVDTSKNAIISEVFHMANLQKKSCLETAKILKEKFCKPTKTKRDEETRRVVLSKIFSGTAALLEKKAGMGQRQSGAVEEIIQIFTHLFMEDQNPDEFLRSIHISHTNLKAIAGSFLPQKNQPVKEK